MHRLILSLIVSTLAMGMSTPASALLNGEMARANLATDCATLGFEVSGKNLNNAVRKKLRNAAELRLRPIGVWSDETPTHPVRWLNIEIFFGPAIFVRTVLYRGTGDTGNGKAGLVIFWEIIGLIPWPRSESDIGVLETASEHLDQFLVEYLRANPECTK